MAPSNEDRTLDWLRADLQEVKTELRDARQAGDRLGERLDGIETRLSDLQRCGMDESRATLQTRAECRREIANRLDSLEKRDLLTLVWDQRRGILGLLGTCLGLLGAAAAYAWPVVVPVLDRIRQVVP